MVGPDKTLPDTLPERYELVRSRVEAAAKRSGRAPGEIVLVAVTKYAGADQIRQLLELGHRDMGENRVQQLAQRAAMVDEYRNRLRVLATARRKVLPDGGDALLATVTATSGTPSSPTDVRWHMIGHLQRNKARKLIDVVRLVHSVDSLRVAEELQAVAIKKDRVVEVLVQVNVSGEQSKSGCPVPSALHLCAEIDTMINVKVRGLMTMAPYGENPEESRRYFGRLRELFEEIRTRDIGEGAFNLLSMGMSGDFEIGIEEGANIVRVGSAIFGEAPAITEIKELDEEPEEGDEEPGR
jgi:pyridoxal phosphate enzyme (YggS family)